MYCFWYFPFWKGSGEVEGTAVTLSVWTNILYWFYTLINELYVNILICMYVFLPWFITAKETGACAPSLWGLLLGERCSCLGLCCEEDTRLLQIKAMLCLSCVSFIKRTKKPTIYQAASHHLGQKFAVRVPAGRAGLAGAGTPVSPSACPSHLQLLPLGHPELLLQLHQHLSEIIKSPYSCHRLPRPGAGSFSCWTARAVAALPLACPAECDTFAPGGNFVGRCERNG